MEDPKSECFRIERLVMLHVSERLPYGLVSMLRRGFFFFDIFMDQTRHARRK